MYLRSVYDGMEKEQTYEEHREAFFALIETPGVPVYLASKAFAYHEEVREFYKKPVSSADEFRVGVAFSARREEEEERQIKRRARFMEQLRQWGVLILVVGLALERLVALFI